MLEIARALLLDPKLIMLDELSIGPAPKMVDAVFHTVRLLRDQGKAVLMGEQNVKKALAQLAFLLERNQARFGGGAENLLARALVRRLRDELREIMRARDAAHAQLGRFFPYLALLEPGALALPTRIKDAFDPGRRMNPVVLGFS